MDVQCLVRTYVFCIPCHKVLLIEDRLGDTEFFSGETGEWNSDRVAVVVLRRFADTGGLVGGDLTRYEEIFFSDHHEVLSVEMEVGGEGDYVSDDLDRAETLPLMSFILLRDISHQRCVLCLDNQIILISDITILIYIDLLGHV